MKSPARPSPRWFAIVTIARKAHRQIEALPNASAVRDPDGGSALVACRKDRVKCSKGASLLKSHKIRQTSVTNRVVAGCCGSAMVLNFDDAKHWVDVYRSRIRQNAPPVEMRICTRFKPANVENFRAICATTQGILCGFSQSCLPRGLP